MEYVNKGEISNAIASMGSDLNKHPETTEHPGMQIGIMMLMAGKMNTAEEAKKFIEGFH